MSGPVLDPSFTALPYRSLGDAALARAQALGASHADFRFERVRYQTLLVRDGALQGANDTEDLGFAVRVIHGGAWGFASGVVLTADEAVQVAETAVAVARVAAKMTSRPVELADEPVHADATWISSYLVNPLDVPVREKADLLIDWTDRLRRGAAVDHASAHLLQVQENKYYADLAGTRTTQQRVRLHPGFEAMGTGADAFDSMASIAPPVGRGWEYLDKGVGGTDSWDWDAEIEEVPELLAEKLKAPSVEAGGYDLVIHPSNLWLTIHESIGHATELDRALGYEVVNQVRRRGYGKLLNGEGNVSEGIKSITRVSGGSGYTSAPTVTITGAGGVEARATATVATSGTRAVTAITLADPGYKFTGNPTITITGGGGTGATATASVFPVSNADVLPAQAADKDSFRRLLQDERARELCYEGLRKFDLIRWGIFLDVMKDVANDFELDAPSSLKFAATGYNNVRVKHLLLPIPTDEIQVNGSMTQNPGW